MKTVVLLNIFEETVINISQIKV